MNQLFKIIAIFVSTISLVSAKCDNACSGHGTCNARSVCACYDNWGIGLSHDSGDCSDRICPYEIAWVDTPDNIGRHHKYAECAAQGICDRTTGECACFPGYEGKGCQRTVCPNDCSGHGMCTYIEDLGFQVVGADAGHVNNLYSIQAPITYPFYSWDHGKTRGCVCDPEWGDIDCSKRMCPYGTDIMDLRDDMDASQKFQVQNISFIPDVSGTDLTGKTFALTFTSKLNETFTTMPIVFDSSTGSALQNTAESIKIALQSLPNRVIDSVTVTNGDYDAYSATFLISFTGDNVQGPQNLLTVKAAKCGAGCTPRLTGMELSPKNQNITEYIKADYNSYECGRRGKCDYTTGICGCFAGYTGNSCNVITALV